MPFHLRTRPDKIRRDYVTDIDIEGNEVADRLAETAATNISYLIVLRFLT